VQEYKSKKKGVGGGLSVEKRRVHNMHVYVCESACEETFKVNNQEKHKRNRHYNAILKQNRQSK